jgi:hypothetical protein
MYQKSAVAFPLRYFEYIINKYSSYFLIQCPEDDNFMNGSPCHENEGTCFSGMCVGAQQQCIDLWGPGANIAHDSCYSNFNPTGSMTGHCGYDSRLNKYIPCFDKYDSFSL